MNLPNDKILDKVKKCLALSKSSESHEAAAALRQAQLLMDKHGISDIHLKFTDIGQEKVRSKFSVSRIKNYESTLIQTVAKAFGCKVLWTKSSSHFYGEHVYGSYVLIGLNSQVKLCSYTCEVLQRKLVKAKNGFVTQLPGHLSRGAKVIEADGFCHGWVNSIRNTVIEFAQGDEAKKLIDEYTSEVFGKMNSAKFQDRKLGRMGFEQGKAAAAEESIQRPINEQARLRLGA